MPRAHDPGPDGHAPLPINGTIYLKYCIFENVLKHVQNSRMLVAQQSKLEPGLGVPLVARVESLPLTLLDASAYWHPTDVKPVEPTLMFYHR